MNLLELLRAAGATVQAIVLAVAFLIATGLILIRLSVMHNTGGITCPWLL